MFIAIISDIHNNIVNLQKVLDYCENNKIKTIVCCGDLASEKTLDFLCDNFTGKILYTFGNMDKDHLGVDGFKGEDIAKYKHAKIFKNHGEEEIAGKLIAFVHFPEEARELCETGKYNFVFHGHTHKPWEENYENCKILNPGNVAGDIYPPTFATWNTKDDKFNLIRIHDLN